MTVTNVSVLSTLNKSNNIQAYEVKRPVLHSTPT